MDNEINLFKKIKLIVINWVEQYQDYFEKNNIKMVILRNEGDGFVVSFESDTSMAEIVVENPEFAPYRFVSFEIVTIEDSQAKIIYSWYDNEYTSENEIREELKKGIDYLINLLE